MVPSVEEGMWYLLDGAAWLTDFLDEVCRFPKSTKNDRVDALSQLATYYRKRAGSTPQRPIVGDVQATTGTYSRSYIGGLRG